VVHGVAALGEAVHHGHHFARGAVQQLLVLVHGQPKRVAVFVVAGEV